VIKGTGKVMFFDYQELVVKPRNERAAELRRLRVAHDPSYKEFRIEYVNKLRWLHSGKGIFPDALRV
jgi:hypothetical protein